MNLKKTRIIAIIVTFIFAFVCHFVYDFIPNFVTSIFFPVNESVWEHMKILYTSIILYGIIDYFVLKKFKIEHNNFMLNLFLISYSSIIVYLAIFLPIYYNIGENMFISIFLILVTYIIVYVLSYYILSMNEKNYNLLWVFLLIFGYFIFGFLTYKPIHSQIFFDTQKEIYGIPKNT